MLSSVEKTALVNAIKAVQEQANETLCATGAGTLGKQIADLNAGTSTDAEIVAAYDALKAWRVSAVDTTVTTLIAEARAA